jgi:hypothetical protein
MSLLHQDSPTEIDDAARGEAFTKGSSHVVWASIVAAVLVSAAIAAYVISGQKPPAVTGEIEQVSAYPHLAETSGLDANGAPMPKQSVEQVLVIARVKLHNQSQQIMALHEILTNVSLQDGIHSSYAATPGDYDRVFIAYPDLADLRGKPLPPETVIDPGQTVEGDFVSSFRLSKPDWEGRKSLTFSFGFKYQPSLTLDYKAAVSEK